MYTDRNDIYVCDMYTGADVFLPVFSKLSLVDSSCTGRCVRMYYTSDFTTWICLMKKTVYLVSLTDFSVKGSGFLCV
jgi:hypothetical protein